MEAKLDASYDQSYVDQTTDEHHRLFEWVRLSEIKADRKLQCTVTSLQPGKSKYFHGKAKIRMAILHPTWPKSVASFCTFLYSLLILVEKVLKFW
jgi:hypothetical protein